MVRKICRGEYEKKGYGVVRNKDIFNMEHPEIGKVFPGTVNVELNEDIQPLYEDEIREKAKLRDSNPKMYSDGNHISPTVRVVRVNDTELFGYLYRGGHGKANHVEMVFDRDISDVLGDRKELKIEFGLLEESECAEIAEFIKNRQPEGNAFWIELHEMAEALFKKPA